MNKTVNELLTDIERMSRDMLEETSPSPAQKIALGDILFAVQRVKTIMADCNVSK